MLMLRYRRLPLIWKWDSPDWISSALFIGDDDYDGFNGAGGAIDCVVSSPSNFGVPIYHSVVGGFVC